MGLFGVTCDGARFCCTSREQKAPCRVTKLHLTQAEFREVPNGPEVVCYAARAAERGRAGPPRRRGRVAILVKTIVDKQQPEGDIGLLKNLHQANS